MCCTELFFSFTSDSSIFINCCYPSRSFWHSYGTHILFICIAWIFVFVYPMGIFIQLVKSFMMLTIKYVSCFISCLFQSSIWDLCVFGIPVSMIHFMYFILVRYVKRMNTLVTPNNTLVRARRNLKIIRRTVVLISIVVTVCFPYQLFVIMSFFNSAPTYNFRISYLFGAILQLCLPYYFIRIYRSFENGCHENNKELDKYDYSKCVINKRL